MSVMRLDLWDVFSLVFEHGIKGYRLEAHHQDMSHWLFPGNIYSQYCSEIWMFDGAILFYICGL